MTRKDLEVLGLAIEAKNYGCVLPYHLGVHTPAACATQVPAHAPAKLRAHTAATLNAMAARAANSNSPDIRPVA